MLYRPRLANGQLAPMAWPMKLFRLMNNIYWPLEENASGLAQAFDRFCWCLAFFVFVATNDAEFRYLRLNLNNLDELLTGVPTYLILIESHLRVFPAAWRKFQFQKLLTKFYAEIYIEESENPNLFKTIQRQYIPISMFSFLYMCALVTYVLIPIYLLSTGQRELLYKMTPIFDYTPLYIYLPTMLSNVWVGFIVATMMFGEPNLIGLQVFHLNGRYIMMREKLNRKVEVILNSKSHGNIVAEFRQLLIATINEHMRLNKFAREVQEEYSFRLFITFGFMAVSLCALGFKVYTSPMTSIGYMFWAIGKIQEVIAWGQIGTSITSITNELSSMYYESKWEAVIQHSSDHRANIRIMKMLSLAIVMNSKPFHLSGFNFFYISLESAVKIIQGAFSYFTCLISFRSVA